MLLPGQVINTEKDKSLIVIRILCDKSGDVILECVDSTHRHFVPYNDVTEVLNTMTAKEIIEFQL